MTTTTDPKDPRLTDLQVVPVAMVEAAADELADHRGMSYPDSWWCECGAEGVVASQDDADKAISHHMARALLTAALSVCEVRREYWLRVASAEGWWNPEHWFGLEPLAGDKYRLVITTAGGVL